MELQEGLRDVRQPLTDMELQTDNTQESADIKEQRMDGIGLLMDGIQLYTDVMQQGDDGMPFQIEAMQQSMYENYSEIDKGAPGIEEGPGDQAASPNKLIDWMDTIQYISDMSFAEEGLIE